MLRTIEEKSFIQAVLVVDDFDNSWDPLTDGRSKGLIPVLNRPLIDFPLRMLQVNGCHEVYVCCKHDHEGIAKHVKENWTGLSMDVHVCVSEAYQSLGDVLRDMDRKARIKGDFILIRGDVIGNICFSKILDEHRARRMKDKGCVMTSVLHKFRGHVGHEDGEGPCLARNRDNKILWYSKDCLRKKTVKIPSEIFKDNSVVHIDQQFINTHVAICSISLLMLYTDNVDHQTQEDFIRGTLDNEDILGNSIYVHFLDGIYSSRIVDFAGYDTVSQEMLSRWSYPLVPDKVNNYAFCQENVFLERNEDGKPIHLSGAVLEKNCMIGGETCVAEDVQMVNTVVGRNCKIGRNSKLTRCYLFEGVVIEDNCVLSHCIIDCGVVVKGGVVAKRGCIFGKNVVVGSGSVLSGLHLRAPKMKETSEVLLGKEGSGVICKKITHIDETDIWGTEVKKSEQVEESEGSPTESEGEDHDYCDEEDYVKTFYSEIMDNFKRGVTENISCDNLILEVNSMKHAYNIPINEVNTLIMQALIEVSDSTSTSPTAAVRTLSLLKFLQPLIKNYVRDERSQADCLLALEEYHLHNKEAFNASMFVKVIKYLYDNDVLEEEVICEWFNDPSGDLSDLIHKAKEEVTEKEMQSRRLSLRKEKLVKQLIQWLEEADEESSEED